MQIAVRQRCVPLTGKLVRVGYGAGQKIIRYAGRGLTRNVAGERDTRSCVDDLCHPAVERGSFCQCTDNAGRNRLASKQVQCGIFHDPVNRVSVPDETYRRT